MPTCDKCNVYYEFSYSSEHKCKPILNLTEYEKRQIAATLINGMISNELFVEKTTYCGNHVDINAINRELPKLLKMLGVDLTIN